MTHIATIERRAAPRIPATGEMSIRGVGTGNLHDLSLNGFNVEVSESSLISLNTNYSAKITIGGEDFSVNCVIRRTTRSNNGKQIVAGVFKTDTLARHNIMTFMVKEALAILDERGMNDAQRREIRKFGKAFKDYLSLLERLSKNHRSSHDLQLLAEGTNQIVTQADTLKTNLNDKLLTAEVKKLFRRYAASWAYKSLIVKRSYDKPKGYPGDYLTLEIIYDEKPISPAGGIGHLFDQYFLSNPYADAVRDRKNFMKLKLASLISSSNNLRVLNLASGSGREIYELFNENPSLKDKNIEFVLYDWDEDALNFSVSRLEALPKNIKITPLKRDILTYAKSVDFFNEFGSFNVIYSIGLSDYLPDRVNRKIIFNSFAGLADGGKFIFAHKDKEINFSHLPPEWFCDWVFIPRNKDEVLSLFDGLDIDPYFGGIKIERGASDDIFYIIAEKVVSNKITITPKSDALKRVVK